MGVEEHYGPKAGTSWQQLKVILVMIFMANKLCIGQVSKKIEKYIFFYYCVLGYIDNLSLAHCGSLSIKSQICSHL